MPHWIFDRNGATHPWAQSFSELEGDVAQYQRGTVCRNWRMDHRVSDPREAHMLAGDGFRDCATGEAWWRERRKYFQRWLCQPAKPTPQGNRSVYLESHNHLNRVPRSLSKDDELLHAGSLVGMLWRLRRSGRQRFWVQLERLVGRPFPLGHIAEWTEFQSHVGVLASSLQAAGEDAVRRFAGLVTSALGRTQPPWFAGFAEELRDPLAAGNGTELCRALGLGHVEAGDWLLAWRYEVGAVRALYPLYRPTVVEANDSPYHFPSPPEYVFGITMSLQGGIPACREVLHAPLEAPLSEQCCTGRLVPVATQIATSHNLLADLRRAHRDRLRREFPKPAAQAWLDRHEAT